VPMMPPPTITIFALEGNVDSSIAAMFVLWCCF
jgi:hypothetical protein